MEQKTQFYITSNSSFVLDEGIDVIYEPGFIDESLANNLFEDLLKEAAWHRPVMYFQDRKVLTRRQVAWHADYKYVYKYSGQEHEWKDWTPAMLTIRELIENKLNIKFNGVLLNLYNDGTDYISPHSDDEDDLVNGSPIVCVSLGETRDFVLKHKFNGNRHIIPLENGSLVIMQGNTQAVSKHSIPKRKNINKPRISLTFRQAIRQT